MRSLPLIAAILAGLLGTGASAQLLSRNELGYRLSHNIDVEGVAPHITTEAAEDGAYVEYAAPKIYVDHARLGRLQGAKSGIFGIRARRAPDGETLYFLVISFEGPSKAFRILGAGIPGAPRLPEITRLNQPDNGAFMALTIFRLMPAQARQAANANLAISVQTSGGPIALSLPATHAKALLDALKPAPPAVRDSNLQGAR